MRLISVAYIGPMNCKQQRYAPLRSTRLDSRTLSDAELVLLAQAGKRAAFDLLTIKYRAAITTLALRYTRHAADAEDVSQDAFICAYKNLRGFRGDCSFRTWLHRIAVNCAKTLLARRAREALVTGLDLLESDGSRELPKGLHEAETPESLTLSDDIRDTVSRAVEIMPEAHRAAIMLREIECLSYEQIATVMAIPVGTVRSRVFRARELIDHQLRHVYEGGLGRGGRARSSAP